MTSILPNAQPRQPLRANSDTVAMSPRAATARFREVRTSGGSNPSYPHIPGYELLEILGRGGMGIVYKARQQGLNRLVALKLILAGDTAAEEDVARFFHEAEAIGALQHPNIVQIYEIGEHEGRPFLSLEFVDGGTLLQTIHNQPQSPAFAVEICETVARAIHAAHAIQIVHRDLKPANILLQPADPKSGPRSGSGRRTTPLAKITDFGLAKRLNSDQNLTATGTVAGTPTYMAPEQVRGDRGIVGPATDIWAIGVILYEILTGRPPFADSCPIQTMSDVLFESPVPPRRLVSTVPRDLETICLKCLEKSPARRYQTALDLADDLLRYREGRPILARRVGSFEQSWRWCVRNPVIASLIAGILLVLAGGASVAGAYAVRAEENASDARQEKTRAEANAGEARAKEADAVRAMAAATEQKGIATELARQAIAREDIGRRERYALEANLALMAWDAGDLNRTRRFLTSSIPGQGEPDLRGFEWRYLDRLCHSELQTIPLKSDRVYAAEWFPDGRRFAFARDREIAIHDLKTGPLPIVLRGCKDLIAAIAIHPKLPQIAAACYDGSIHVWDANTGTSVYILRGHPDSAHDLIYTPDGESLISCGGRFSGLMKPGEVIIWNLATGTPRHTMRPHSSAVNTLAISADGKRLASCGYEGLVQLYELPSGQTLRGVVSRRPISSLAIDPRGTWVAAGSSSGPISIYDTHAFNLLRELHSHADEVQSLNLNADGTRLASGGMDGNVRVWNPGTGELLRNYRGHVGSVRGVRFQPKRPHVLSVASDGEARIWDTEKKPEYTRVQITPYAPIGMHLSADGTRILTLSQGGTMQMCDTATGAKLPCLDQPVGDRFLSGFRTFADGDTMAILCGDGSIIIRSCTGKPLPAEYATITRGHELVVSRDDRWLAVQTGAEVVRIHDRKNPGKPREFQVPSTILSLTFGPGAEPWLGVATESEGVRLIRVDTGATADFPLPKHVSCGKLAFSQDGTRLAVADSAARLRLWDIASRRQLWIRDAHTGGIESIAFSRSGNRMLTASQDRTARLFDAETGSETIALRGHSRGVIQALFGPDDASVYTLGIDDRLLRWDGAPR